MEQISRTMGNALPARLSQTESIAKEIPVEKRRAMGDIFDRWRLNCGWNPWDDVTQGAAISSFVHSLDRENVPVEAYSELYERVLQLRATAMQSGKQIPQFGVDLLLSAWGGDWGLRNELRQKEIERGRSLPEVAESVCEQCFGTGFRTEKIDGYSTAIKCEH